MSRNLRHDKAPAHLLAAYVELRKSLMTRILDESVATVEDAEAGRVLRKINGGEGLPSDRFWG